MEGFGMQLMWCNCTSMLSGVGRAAIGPRDGVVGSRVTLNPRAEVDI